MEVHAKMLEEQSVRAETVGLTGSSKKTSSALMQSMFRQSVGREQLVVQKFKNLQALFKVSVLIKEFSLPRHVSRREAEECTSVISSKIILSGGSGSLDKKTAVVKC